jgi:hypothetical protein
MLSLIKGGGDRSIFLCSRDEVGMKELLQNHLELTFVDISENFDDRNERTESRRQQAYFKDML